MIGTLALVIHRVADKRLGDALMDVEQAAQIEAGWGSW